MEHFPDELILRKLNDENWEVVEPFNYFSNILGEWITVPKGLKTDLASVPWYGRWYVSRDGDHTKPALVHDFLYTKDSEEAFPDIDQAIADKIFLEAMAVRGVRKPTRVIMYFAVWLGGGKSFRRPLAQN